MVVAKVIGDLCAPNGKYIKDGEEKTRWLKCGIVLETDNGMRVKLECVPVGTDFEGWFSVFEKKESNTRKVSTSQDDEPF
jgi:hypothetical protein